MRLGFCGLTGCRNHQGFQNQRAPNLNRVSPSRRDSPILRVRSKAASVGGFFHFFITAPDHPVNCRLVHNLYKPNRGILNLAVFARSLAAPLLPNFTPSRAAGCFSWSMLPWQCPLALLLGGAGPKPRRDSRKPAGARGVCGPLECQSIDASARVDSRANP